MQIQTIWLNSKESEAKRLLHTAHQIALHFYQINGFMVLPELPSGSKANSIVVFPEIPFSKIPHFWDTARRLDINKTIKADIEILEQITTLLQNNEITMSEVKENWKKAETSVYTFLNNLLPEQTKNLTQITIFPTRYGTSCSFNRLADDATNLEIYLRYDSGVGEIIEAIITSLTRTKVIENLKGTWSESEMITDWIMTQSAMNEIIEKYCPEYNPTILNIRKVQSKKIQNISDVYLKKLGYSINHKLITYNNDKFLINNLPLKKLTEKEMKVLSKLVMEYKITTEDLANVLFENNDDYSLYAMAKFIQRLRDKLELYGLTGSYIQTIRGFGYRIPNY